jgi:hypothetical protein
MAFNMTTASNLFKIRYGKLSDNVYNSANVLLGRVKKNYDFTGKRKDIAVPTSFAGGVGSGSLPTANAASYEDAQISAKKMYAVIEVDREAIKAAENDEGAFVRMTKHSVQKGVESWMRNMQRTLLNDGSGALGTVSANATGSASAPVVVISAATWKEANWEEKDYINFDSDSSVFEIVSVAPSTRTITLSRVSGALDLTSAGSGAVAYMQNSKDNDPEGLKGICDATSGSKYGITIARRWKAFQKSVSAGLTTDYMNEVMLGVEKQCGKVPNLILTSYTQYRKLLNILEDQKVYQLDPRSQDLKGKVSFRGVEFMSNAGPVGVFADRFVEDDRMYFLNDNYIEIHHRPGFGWFDDDGTVFLRKASSDAYEARYGGYLQSYIVPSFQGVLTGLTT